MNDATIRTEATVSRQRGLIEGFDLVMALAADPRAKQHDVNAGVGVFRGLVASAHYAGDIDALQNALIEIVRRTVRADPPEAAFAHRAYVAGEEAKLDAALTPQPAAR